MPKHVTDVREIREIGILLKTRGQHVVRVLGTLPQAAVPRAAPMKEEQQPRLDAQTEQHYLSGALAGEQEDPGAKEYHPRVPSLFVTRAGQPVFLKRDWSK